MANQQHLDLLEQGVEVWNQWRKQHPDIYPDLRDAGLTGADLREADLTGADLSGADLSGADLTGADLREANLSDTNLSKASLTQADLSKVILHRTLLSEAILHDVKLKNADLSKADLRGANFSDADLRGANLNDANLRGANLSDANLSDANLRGADLSDATLTGATLIRSNLTYAKLTNAFVYGIAAWDLRLEGTIQQNLVITSVDQPTITVDNLEIAQFIYLFLNNSKVRDVINTISSKIVLLLGRFTPDRRVILDALQEGLRKLNYLPVVFDFDRPASRDLTETLSTLAHLSRFIIADLTDARSLPRELASIIPFLQIPVQPIIIKAKQPYSMFSDLTRYHWVLPTYVYGDLSQLLSGFAQNIIEPSEQKAVELELK